MRDFQIKWTKELFPQQKNVRSFCFVVAVAVAAVAVVAVAL